LLKKQNKLNNGKKKKLAKQNSVLIREKIALTIIRNNNNNDNRIIRNVTFSRIKVQFYSKSRGYCSTCDNDQRLAMTQ